MNERFVLQETIRVPGVGEDKAYLKFAGQPTPQRVPFAGQATKFTREKAQRFADVFAQKTPPSEKANLRLEVLDCGEEFNCTKCGRAYCRIDLESSIKASPVSLLGAVTGAVAGTVNFTCECGGEVPFERLHFVDRKVDPNEATEAIPQVPPSLAPAKSGTLSNTQSPSTVKKWWEFWR